jgi:hypothetical protein
VGVAGEHGARDVPGDAHDHLVARARLRKLRHERVAVVVPAASAKPVDSTRQAGGNTAPRTPPAASWRPSLPLGGAGAPVGGTGRERGPMLAGQRPAADGKVRCFVVGELRPSGRRNGRFDARFCVAENRAQVTTRGRRRRSVAASGTLRRYQLHVFALT